MADITAAALRQDDLCPAVVGSGFVRIEGEARNGQLLFFWCEGVPDTSRISTSNLGRDGSAQG